MEIYHGSNTIVKQPEILVSAHYKDFGYGFYCTNNKKQAIRWALTKKPAHIVNVYEYTEKPELNIKRFEKMTEEWLDFVAACRCGEPHDYDIVEGPMADDTIWNYVEDFLANEITREAFWELVKFRYPTHQILFSNEKALKCLSFKGSEKL
ncbi:MAG: DUF3990 domain-containing protein [Roseburia sp.]|nr:DUF3990 domain-containing protein [Roseburia sp.]MCM1279057.1 DUF3990 domain-containing protein [Robinsoniella sp.]